MMWMLKTINEKMLHATRKKIIKSKIEAGYMQRCGKEVRHVRQRKQSKNKPPS